MALMDIVIEKVQGYEIRIKMPADFSFPLFVYEDDALIDTLQSGTLEEETSTTFSIKVYRYIYSPSSVGVHNLYIKSDDSVNGYNTLTYDVTELPKTDDEIKVENVYINGKKVMAIRIGSAITDENGIASLSYEATGAGEVNLFATCGDLVSNTITIMDKPEDFSAIITVDWLDNGNMDGNRPDSIDVTLYKDDVEITGVTLSESQDWIYDLSALELPKYENEETINYSISYERTAGYNAIIEDFHIIQDYNPPVTSASIQISWQDNNDAAGKRPVSIIATLSNGATVKLNTSNNWFATLSNLPTLINKKTVSYSWVDPDIYGYKINGKGYSGKTTYYFMALK